jgi:hypothetical protein
MPIMAQPYCVLSTGGANLCHYSRVTGTRIFFSDYFGVPRSRLDAYGAFDINLVSDLPLFVDPFLLFNSPKPEYQALHEEIIRYLVYLRDLSNTGTLAPATVRDLYRFQEVKQNWLGYTFMGNGGHGLGQDFATALNTSLGRILRNFGEPGISRGSHLEKLALIRPRVGKDNISDFTTNLIKHYLLDFTENFARTYIDPSLCDTFGVKRARFNYTTETWATEQRYLPRFGNDFVLLSPVDLLTHDETWINYPDMVERYPQIVDAVENPVERDRIERYFRSRLSEAPKPPELKRAAMDTLSQFPELLDIYIRLREDAGDEAVAVSAKQREELRVRFVDELSQLITDLLNKTDVGTMPETSYDEALAKAKVFKDYIENRDGYLLINREGRGSSEKDVQLFFGLALMATRFDVNREANNGRGPVDFALSDGSKDKSLIEFKLARNTKLEQNLRNQLPVYQAANSGARGIKVILFYTEAEERRVNLILKRLGLEDKESIIVIDARPDNKPSGSNA